jgi:glucokinase
MIGAIDIGGTKIAVGLVDPGGQIIASTQFATRPERGYEDCRSRIIDHLRGLCSQHEGSLRGIGIGCTGPIGEQGIFLEIPFLHGWKGHDLCSEISAEFGVSAVIENDADAAALGEYLWGSGRNSQRMIFVTVSTGIGAGVVIDGSLYRGVDGSHPECGHHIIDPSGPLCDCGAHGCWESLASGTAFGREGERLGGEAYSDVRGICRLADAGDALALKLVQRQSHFLGLGLANLVIMFGPDCIVLGGGVMNRWDLFEAGVRDVIRTSCGLSPWQRTRLVTASQGSQSGLAGAAAVWAVNG